MDGTEVRLTILDMFGVTPEYLTEVVLANPSLRGVIIGNLAERKLWDILAADARITGIRKDDDHDRVNKGDMVVTYRGFDFRMEVKSHQTNSVKIYRDDLDLWMPKIIRQGAAAIAGASGKRKKWVECEKYRSLWVKSGATGRYKGSVQCDASDNREITLPNGSRVKTTNLKVGEFDILAMGLYAFREKWDFGFVLNGDLARTESEKYRQEDRQYLLKTTVPITWPLPASAESDPFVLLDRLVKERRRKKPSTDTS